MAAVDAHGRASARSHHKEDATEYAFRYLFKFTTVTLKRWLDYIEDIDGVEILSVGNGLELIKDLGDAAVVAEQYGLQAFRARTPSGTPGWRPNPMSIFARRIPTGRIPIMTSRSFTTARSPTTGSCAVSWSAGPSLHVEL